MGILLAIVFFALWCGLSKVVGFASWDTWYKDMYTIVGLAITVVIGLLGSCCSTMGGDNGSDEEHRDNR